VREARSYPSVVYEIVVDRFRRGSGRGEAAAEAWGGEDDCQRHHGGDLYGVVESLDHLESLGVDTLVLSPICPSSSALGDAVEDFLQVSDELGGAEAFEALVAATHARGMRLILTGIFDRVGRAHPWFVEGATQQEDDGRVDPARRSRSFFRFGVPPFGYAAYRGDADLPELDLSDHHLRHKLFHGDRSVVRTWLQRGVDGWRVDHADSLGYDILREVQRATRSAAAESVVVGDTRSYAEREVRDGIVDGVVNHYLREAVVGYLSGRIPAQELSRILDHQRQRYGARGLVRCWNVLSDAGSERVLSALEGSLQRMQLAVRLQYVLPGAALIFYGDEVGTQGEALPQARCPMRWNEADWNAELLDTYRRMGAFRREHPAAVSGDISFVTPRGEADVFALVRRTRTPRETIVAAFNRSATPRCELLFVPVEGLVDGLPMVDVDTGVRTEVCSGTIEIEVPPLGSAILVPDPDSLPGYTFIKDR